MSLNLKRQTIQQRIVTLLDKLPTEALLVIEQVTQLLYRQLVPVDNKMFNDESVSLRSEPTGAVSLMAMAGMFESGHDDTSENVKTIVSDFILEKHAHDSSTR
ncbi:hypothetical protein QUF63_17440 [Anaerolineales bacterium HSG25]|nr:hypothetical protein [Anaerolineales bacterium HSG25]